MHSVALRFRLLARAGPKRGKIQTLQVGWYASRRRYAGFLDKKGRVVKNQLEESNWGVGEAEEGLFLMMGDIQYTRNGRHQKKGRNKGRSTVRYVIIAKLGTKRGRRGK